MRSVRLAAAGNTSRIWPSSDCVRRRATRKSWRNSVSSRSRTPASFASRMSAIARWICLAPTSARTDAGMSRRSDATSSGSTYAELPEDDAIEPFRTPLDAGTAEDQRHEARIGIFVAAKSGQRHDSRQRPPGRTRHRQTRPARPNAQARDGLALAIQDLEQRSVLFCLRLGDQATHANDGRHLLMERTIRKIPDESRRLPDAGRYVAPVAGLPVNGRAGRAAARQGGRRRAARGRRTYQAA